MSTLKTNTIQHLTSGFNNVIAHTDGAGTANAVHCRAWVNFNGTSTVTIRASFNVSSITDVNTGQYRVNLTNALADGDYAAIALSEYNDSATQAYFIMEDTRSGGRTASLFPLSTHNNAAFGDAIRIQVAFFR